MILIYDRFIYLWSIDLKFFVVLKQKEERKKQKFGIHFCKKRWEEYGISYAAI